ncbi:MAG: PcfJ domain-containing protein [Planctomycetes bacterium]|nr:PcfJ domain-containing protein [Planctomycetota bacterium]MCH9725848.1 PcfJ domain-containing protein [Planctomycetota bacterium]MCH9775412.1 PcfJ domain-containing protein [Planctomycetota bacterium]MCH9790267.1 PcfJ domain-containing protein [Planctomycetota bacterium]
MTSQNQKHHASRRLDDLITHCAQKLPKHRKQFWKLIYVIRDKTSLLSPRAGTAYTNPTCAEQIVRSCERMVRRRYNWQRYPEAWVPPDASPFVQMRSLVQHLFDQYAVPNFMASVWWKKQYASWELALYLHLAKGLSLRQFSVLNHLRITRRMAALFMQAPDDLRLIESIRWGHVLSLGGDDRLARILISQTCLGMFTRDEEFWETVIRFLIQNQPLSAEEIVEMVRFIHEQRFEPAEIVWGRGAGDDPVQPEFTLRGRTLMSLRRHQANWRSELIEKGFMPPPHVHPLDFPWQRSEISSFRFEEEGTAWTIDELLTPRELRNEGRIMQHCVAEYISDCARGKTTIWSMKCHEGKQKRRTLTIEVAPKAKVILQASGKQNCTPSVKVSEILNRWAKQESLWYETMA